MNVKVYYLVFSIFFGSAINGFTQNTNPSESNGVKYAGSFEFGLQHSINLTTLSGKNNSYNYGQNRVVELEPVGRRLTIDLGMFSNFYITKMVSLDFEVLYSYMGAHIDKETTVLHDLGEVKGTDNESYALQYFRFPLLLKVHPSEKAFIEFGGYAATLLSAEKFYPWTVDSDYSREKLDGISSFDAGIIAGVGFDLKIVNLGFRYNYGLINVFEDQEPLDLRNSMFQIVAQWKLYSDIKKQK